ncbi:MAG: phosphoribosylanthranilate isomerase [Desulforhopalus sp.]
MSDIINLRTRVKMCGTTRLTDAMAAIHCGVDALGFIFYPKSPRYITYLEANGIIDRLPMFIDRVGVFVNEEMTELVAAANAGITYLQLHGSESVEYCQELRQKLPSCKLIKAFRVGVKSRAEEFTPYNHCVDGFLLDTYVEGTKGGTGEVFDWSLIENLELQLPILLAGGLTPENIVQAITQVRPYAVDINSGVESRPGIKDHHRLHKLMRLVGGSSDVC